MGEYEPEDSRNITGTASTPDGRWTNRDGKAPMAPGESREVRAGDRQLDPKADTLSEKTDKDLPAVPLAVERAAGE